MFQTDDTGKDSKYCQVTRYIEVIKKLVEAEAEREAKTKGGKGVCVTCPSMGWILEVGTF